LRKRYGATFREPSDETSSRTSQDLKYESLRNADKQAGPGSRPEGTQRPRLDCRFHDCKERACLSYRTWRLSSLQISESPGASRGPYSFARTLSDDARRDSRGALGPRCIGHPENSSPPQSSYPSWRKQVSSGCLLSPSSPSGSRSLFGVTSRINRKPKWKAARRPKGPIRASATALSSYALSECYPTPRNFSICSFGTVRTCCHVRVSNDGQRPGL